RIFQVLFGLALLVTLLVAGVSFRPLTVEEDLNQFNTFFNGIMGLNPQQGQPQFACEDFRQTNDAPVPWQGDYRLDFVVRCTSAEKLELAKKSGLPVTPNFVKRLLQQQLYYLDNVKVEELPSPPPGELRFRVTSRGTKVTDAEAWPHGMRWMGLSLWWLNVFLGDHSLRQEVYRVEK